MSLPAMTPDGLLPVGVYAATLDEVRARFVEDSPAPWEREATFAALQILLGQWADLAGHGTVWIGGGFTTHMPGLSPRPLTVYWCQDLAHLEQVVLADGALEHLTLRGVAVSHPLAAVAPVLRPMGGLVDAYLASPRMIDFFDGVLSRVSGRPGMMQGYLEVSL